MSDFQRFAIFHLPDDPALAEFGATWLGWDVRTGAAAVQPPIDGIEAITATPRKYGFHGTLKPPFRLAEGTTRAGLEDAVVTFAAQTAPVTLDGLAVSAIGQFLALTPVGPVDALGQLAFDIVRNFDGFRRPADAKELQRRRAAGLSARQDELLLAWGYPYVDDQFRFHLTLTGKLSDDDQRMAQDALLDILPNLPSPYEIRSISLVGERADGRFQLIHRYALTG